MDGELLFIQLLDKTLLLLIICDRHNIANINKIALVVLFVKYILIQH